MLMQQQLIIDNLAYEELVLLQQIMIDLRDSGMYARYDQDVFDELFEKIMVSWSMKYLYLVNYWVPFPSSEYGGLIAVVAENDNQCHDVLIDWRDECESSYDDRIQENVYKATRLMLSNEEDEEIGIVDSFLTWIISTHSTRGLQLWSWRI